jgi:hypothetical protein
LSVEKEDFLFTSVADGDGVHKLNRLLITIKRIIDGKRHSIRSQSQTGRELLWDPEEPSREKVAFGDPVPRTILGFGFELFRVSAGRMDFFRDGARSGSWAIPSLTKGQIDQAGSFGSRTEEGHLDSLLCRSRVNERIPPRVDERRHGVDDSTRKSFS